MQSVRAGAVGRVCTAHGLGYAGARAQPGSSRAACVGLLCAVCLSGSVKQHAQGAHLWIPLMKSARAFGIWLRRGRPRVRLAVDWLLRVKSVGSQGFAERGQSPGTPQAAGAHGSWPRWGCGKRARAEQTRGNGFPQQPPAHTSFQLRDIPSLM